MSLDTLSYVRQLEAAGVPRPQAEAHASALREHLEREVVTHADLGAAVDRLEARIDKLDLKLEAGEKRSDTKIDSVENRLDAKIGSVEKHLDAKLDAHLQRIESTMWKVGFGVLGGVLAIGGLLLRLAR